jgi:hypothetical protein
MRTAHRTFGSLVMSSFVLLAACTDASAPVAPVVPVAPLAAHTGGPDLSDYNAFPGELWVCPDVPYPVIGFIYRWSIVDNATNQVVQSGFSTNVTAGICIQLASVSTLTPGNYTATVREDPAAHFKISSITSRYGTNLPITPPTPNFPPPVGKVISNILTNDYGVVFTFYH